MIFFKVARILLLWWKRVYIQGFSFIEMNVKTVLLGYSEKLCCCCCFSFFQTRRSKSRSNSLWACVKLLAVSSLNTWASLVAHMVKSLLAMQETQVQSLGGEDPLEKEMATLFSILAWRIPWTEDPGGLHSMGSQRIRHTFCGCIFNAVYSFIVSAKEIYNIEVKQRDLRIHLFQLNSVLIGWNFSYERI